MAKFKKGEAFREEQRWWSEPITPVRAHAINVDEHELLTVVYRTHQSYGDGIRYAVYVDGKQSYGGVVGR